MVSVRLLMLFLAGFAFGGCAVQSSPDGGALDKQPPLVVRSTPENRSLHFNSSKIRIQFDEYVRIQDFPRQFFASPPLKYPVKHSLRGKTLTLEIADTLRENTTYTLSFGNAIQDITENNAQKDFKYVFSTGAVLDSQVVSGEIIQAFSTRPASGLLVGLYEANSGDSAFMTENPQYYGITNEDGQFTIENVVPGVFRCIAFRDVDFNFRWSGPAEELAFRADTLNSAQNPHLHLSAFRPAAEYAFRRAQYASFGRIELFFTSPAWGVDIAPLGADLPMRIEYPDNADTLQLWVKNWEEGAEYSWLIRHPEQDTADTAKVVLYRKDTTAFRLNWPGPAQFAPSDSILLNSATPLDSIDPSRVRVLKHDSIPVDFEISQRGLRNLHIEGQWDYRTSYTVVLERGALRDFYGRQNDSTGYLFRVPAESDLSILHYSITSSTESPKILELFNVRNVVIHRERFTNAVAVDLYNLLPEQYNARVIYDRNGNGQWDPGDYFDSRQPERVIYAPKKIELRANWELDETWIID